MVLTVGIVANTTIGIAQTAIDNTIPTVAAAEIQFATTTPSLRDKVRAAAFEYKVSEEKMVNIIDNETAGTWDPESVGDHGKSWGLAQIHSISHPKITKEQAFDADFAIEFLAKNLAKGNDTMWTSCSCVKYARISGAYNLPRGDARALVPNVAVQDIRAGDVIVLWYGKEAHVAYVIKDTGRGWLVKEANFEPCKAGTRVIAYGDSHVAGGWRQL